MSNENMYPIWSNVESSRNQVRKYLMTNNLRLLRLKAKLSQDALAKRMGTTRSQFVKLERGERRLTDQWITRAAQALGVQPSALIERATVPLLGRLGGRGVLELFASSSVGEVEAPPESSPQMAAIEVGAGVTGLDEGWLIYYDDRKRPATDDLLGALCVIGLPDGQIVVRKIMQGRTPGLFHLHAPGLDPIFDQAVQWAARVAWIRPQ